MEDIHPNLPPISPPLLTQFDWIVIAILVCGLLYAMWTYARLKQQDKTEKRIKPVSKPVQSFAKALKDLQNLKEIKKWKVFALKATALLKRELAHKFSADFEFATGSEIHTLLKEKGASKELLENVQTLFVALDPVKFAKAKTKEDIAQNVINILTSIHSSSKST